MGVVSKLRFYTAPEVGGFTATIRRIYQFLKARGYPTRWWLRPLAIAFVRVGVAVPCLPRLLRFALSWPSERARRQNGYSKWDNCWRKQFWREQFVSQYYADAYENRWAGGGGQLLTVDNQAQTRAVNK